MKILKLTLVAVVLTGCSTSPTKTIPENCKADIFKLTAEEEKYYEKPPTLKAHNIVPEFKLSGPHFKVASTVPTDGFLMQIKVESDFGTFEASSPAALDELIVEIAALEQLQNISKMDAFVGGMKHSLVALGKDVKDIVTSPVQSISGIPAGIGRFFERTYLTTKTGIKAIGSNAVDDQRCGLGGKFPGELDSPAVHAEKPNAATMTAKQTGKVAMNVLGYYEQRRALAKKLRVSPYTTNSVLSEELDSIAWASFSGGLGISALKIAAPATMIINMTSRTSSWVWDTKPGDLKVMDEESLQDMGVAQESTDYFLRHRQYTVTLRHRLVLALEQLKTTTGRKDILELALTVESELQAQFVVEAVEMLAKYHQTEKEIAKIGVNGTIIGHSINGDIVTPAPVSYLSWNKRLKFFASKKDLQSNQKTILLGDGLITPLAKQELAQLGWTIK